MNLDGTQVELRVDLEDLVWAILRQDPDMQVQVIHHLLHYTDEWSVIREARGIADELLDGRGE